MTEVLYAADALAVYTDVRRQQDMKTARLVAISFGVLAALGIAGLAVAAPPAGAALADLTTMPSTTLSASAIVTPTATVTGTVPITGTPTVTGTIANNQKVANAIATYFNVPLTEILALRDDGMGYGEIVIAYNLAKQTGQSVDEIIALRQAGEGWGKIVQSLDVKPGRWAEILAES